MIKEVRMKSVVRFFVGSFIVLSGSVATAAATTYVWSKTPLGATVAEAPDYCQGSNWDGGTAANSVTEDLIASFFPDLEQTSVFQGFVRASGPVRVGGLQTTGWNPGLGAVPIAAYVSESPLTLDPDSRLTRAWSLYCPVVASQADYPCYLQGVDFCGDVSGKIRGIGYEIKHRFDRYANAPGGNRTGGLPSFVGLNSSSYYIYPPNSTSADVTGTWRTTAGKPYLFPVGKSPVLAAGTVVVASDAVPVEAFIRRIFPDGSVEMSQVATATLQEASVTFAAQRATLDVRIEKVTQSTVDPVIIASGRYAADDTCRIEIDALTSVGPTSGRTRFSVTSGYHSPHFVLHDAQLESPVSLGSVTLEFAENAKGPAGIPFAKVYSEADSQPVTFVVTNGIEAVIGRMETAIAPYTKTGAGMLTVALTNSPSANTGSFTVEEGTLAIIAPADGSQAVAALTVKAGATLRVAAGVLSVGTLTVEEGAILEGPGTLSASFGTIRRFTLRNGAAVMPVDADTTGSYSDVPTPATPAEIAAGDFGVPALWLAVDGGAAGMETETNGATIAVRRWNDVRGASYGTTASFDDPPTLLTNGAGVARLVRFAYKTTSAIADAQTLAFGKITGIREVIKVSVPCEYVTGGGYFGEQVLGGSELWREAQVDPMLRVFHSSHGAYPAIANGRIFFNGIEASPIIGVAYPYRGYTSSITNPDMFVPVVTDLALAEPGVNADNLAANAGDRRNGCQFLAEVLIFTNALTSLARERITGYLMGKYLNAEIESTPTPSGPVADLNLGEGRLDVAAGTVVNVPSLGSGVFRKGGSGTLLVDDAADAGVGLDVRSGTVVIKSVEPSSADVPDGAYIHVDPSDTRTYGDQDGAHVKSIADVRGDGYLVATAHVADSAAWWPSCKTDSSCGLNMISHGSLKQYSLTGKSHEIYDFPECPDIRTVFYVTDTEKGNGGFLLADNTWRSAGPQADGHLWGLYRNNWGAGNPIIAVSGTRTLQWSGTGAGRMLVNGAVQPITTATFTGTGVDVVSTTMMEGVGVMGFGGHNQQDAYQISGSCYLGEQILFQKALSRRTVARVDAYLRKKWRGESTPGYRPAVLGSLSVAAGATVTAYGTAPVTVSSLGGAGTVAAPVVLADNAELTVSVADGTTAPLTVSGSFALPAHGTVRLVGDPVKTLSGGTHVLVAATSFAAGETEWTVVFDGEVRGRTFAVRREGNALVLDVIKDGFLMLVK